MRKTGLLAVVWFLACLTLPMKGQELPKATMQHGAFGFPNPSGTSLLTVADVPKPTALHEAHCSDGSRFPVRFARHQAEREGHNGRQTPYNFDKLAGDVFTVLRGRIGIDAICFLASESLLSSGTLVPVGGRAGLGDCGAELRRQLASSRSRQVVNCWPIAGPPANRRIALVEFARQDKDALASVVLMDGERILFADYPAVLNGEGADLWRADDGGVLSAEGFHVVFLLQRAAFYALAISWSAPEGVSLAVFVSNGDNRFARVIEDYWYWAPV